MSEAWIDKYKPRRLDELVGQSQVVRRMLQWARSWRKGEPEKSALLLHGATGTGKTVSVIALAQELEWDLVKLDASDERTFQTIWRIAGIAATTGTLAGGVSSKRLILLDEVDSIHGITDRGLYRAIKELIESARNPVVLIADDPYAVPREIREMCLVLNFKRLTSDSVVKTLKRICDVEQIEVDPNVLKKIAETSKGDLRSAINDLQTMAIGKGHLKVEDLTLHQRDRQANIFDVLRRLVRIEKSVEARELMRTLDQTPEDSLAWISENIPRMLKGLTDLVKVYDAISRADMFLSRAKKRGTYKLWGYAIDLMSSGVALSSKGKLDFIHFRSPDFRRYLGKTKDVRALRDSVAKKIASHCHTSSRIARKHFLPYLSLIFKRNAEIASKIATGLGLNETESRYLESV